MGDDVDVPCHPGDAAIKGYCGCPWRYETLAALLQPVWWLLPAWVQNWVAGDPCWDRPRADVPWRGGDDD